MIRSLLSLLLFISFDAKAVNILPKFRVQTQDGSYITNHTLKKDKKLIFIYFSPDCPHCNFYTIDLIEHLKELKESRILMVTYSSLKSIQQFYKDLHLNRYPQFIVSTEVKPYPLLRHFNISTMPFTAVYNRKQQLKQVYPKCPKIDILLDALKKMQ